MKKLEYIKSQVTDLSPKDKQELITYLKNSYSVFSDYVNVKACPHCKSTKIVKNGTRNGHHKYICRNCKKNFTYRTKTPLSSIQKLNQWNIFLEDFMSLNLTPVRELKKKVGVSEQTVFNWRHKLLSTLVLKDQVFENDIIEFDEANFLISRKGRQEMGITDKEGYTNWRRSQVGESDYNVKVFVSYGRFSKQLNLWQSGMGRTKKDDMKMYFTKKRFKNIKVYCDMHPTYKGFFKDNDIPFETFLSKKHTNWEKPEVHNQTVNSYIRNFKDFTNTHMRGVSTKYIDLYMKWFQFIHETKQAVDNQLQAGQKVKFNIADNICKEVVGNTTGLEVYRRLEISYQGYLMGCGRTDYGTCKNHYYKPKMSRADLLG